MYGVYGKNFQMNIVELFELIGSEPILYFIYYFIFQTNVNNFVLLYFFRYMLHVFITLKSDFSRDIRNRKR